MLIAGLYRICNVATTCFLARCHGDHHSPSCARGMAEPLMHRDENDVGSEQSAGDGTSNLMRRVG